MNVIISENINLQTENVFALYYTLKELSAIKLEEEA